MEPHIFKFLQQRQLHTQKQVDAYHQSEYIGHTKIVNFETYGPTALRDDFKIKPTEAMEFGSIVDTLLTRSEEFTKIYYIPSTECKLTPSESVFVNYMFENRINPHSITNDELLQILDLCKTYSIYTKNIDKRVEKAQRLFPIIVEMLDNAHKQVITTQQFNDATNCIQALKTSDMTKYLFENPKQILYQVELNDTMHHIHCLFDIIYVDFKNHIIHPIDLKCTSYPEREFISNSFYKFKYYRQAELYTEILRVVLRNNCNINEEWKIAPFKFLVVCKNTLSPMLYEFPIKYQFEGEEPNVCRKLIISENRTVDDIYKIISDIEWHRRNRQYMYDKDTYIQLFKQNNAKQKSFVTKPILNIPEEEKFISLEFDGRPTVRSAFSLIKPQETLIDWDSSPETPSYVPHPEENLFIPTSLNYEGLLSELNLLTAPIIESSSTTNIATSTDNE